MTVAPQRDVFAEAGAGSSAADLPPAERGPRADPTFRETLRPPTGPPVKALAAHGAFHSITDVNDRTQAVVEAHTRATGIAPSPGLTLSIVASRVPIEHIPQLFTAPQTEQQARTSAVARSAEHQAAQHRTQNPFDYVYERSDGLHQFDNPVRVLLQTTQQAPPVLTAGSSAASTPMAERGPRSAIPLPTKYPWVAEGALPLPNLGHVYDALRYLNEQGGQDLQVVSQGQNLQEFARESARAGALTPDELLVGRSMTNEAQALAANLTPEQSAARRARAQIATIADAQRQLNKEMGTTLPVTGFFDQEWTKTLGNWMSSADYFRRQTSFQAQQAGYGSNVDAYEKAWQAKQGAVRKHGLFSHFLSVMPLQLFGHNGALGVSEGLWSYVSQNKSPEQMLFSPISTSLHGLTRTAGLALNVVGGTVDQVKADLAAGNEFAKTLAPHVVGGKGETLEEAKEAAARTLVKNPSWLRVFAPDVTESAVESVPGRIANVAGDLVLLGKPSLTGERVLAGDVNTAAKSRYLRSASKWAYNDLAKYGKNGIGRAAARLEGGQGAKALVARAAPLVKRGEMSQEQFEQHVAELYATGKTTIPAGRTVGVTVKTPEPYVSRDRDFVGSVPDQAREEGYLYHRTTPEALSGVRETGLQPTKPIGDSEGVYFANDPLQAAGLAWKNKNNVYLRVAKERVPGLTERAFGESVTTRAISAGDLEYLGDDGAWHPLTGVVQQAVNAEVSGPLLATLRTDKLPAPGVSGRAWLTAKSGMRKTLDDFDTGARGSSVVGTDNAANLVSSLRVPFAHAQPHGVRGFFDETLPENVFNFVMKNRLDAGGGVAATANKLESQLVRFQGTENVVGIQAVQRKIRDLYRDKFPLGESQRPDDPFEAILATEAPSLFRFPGGGEQEVRRALGTLANSMSSANRLLNRLAMLHSRIILSGFPVPGGGLSLFWKHAIGDTLRTEVGGGGVLSGTLPEVRAAKQEIEELADSDPAISRKLGTFRLRAVLGETRWLLDRGGHTFRDSFNTGDPKFQRANYLDAAGGHLRRLLDDDALAAYQRGITVGHFGDLVDLILKNRTYRGMWKSARAKMRAQGQFLQAEDYADAVAARFHDASDALAAQGLSLDDARAVLQANRGAKVDHALGQWLKDNRIDMNVTDALVEPRGTFDDLTGRYIGNVVMRPNKWNRGRFSENVLGKTYAEMRSAGLEPREALDVSLDLASRLTKYHMLDFANRLQIEQDLRWISYFATKHRLYWKWLTGTFLRHPKYAAAIHDFAQNLDDHGNLGDWHVHGVGVTIPAARLVWVPGKEYSEVSPPAQFMLGVVKSGGTLEGGLSAMGGTFGNVIGRSDTAINLGIHLAAMAAGKIPATYGGAVKDVDPRTAARINRALNEYQTTYMNEHGHYAPEADAVKHVLWAQTAEELWRANLPLPVVPNNLDQRGVEQKQMAEYMMLTDPKARREYLDAHPGVADLFGVYTDPKTYLHNRDLFGRYTTALDGYRSARTYIYEQARQGGMTPELVIEKRQLDAAFQKTFDGLLKEDATFAGVDTGGRTPDGIDVPYGPWGKLAAADPQLDPRHALNALFPKLKRSEDFKVYGVLQRQLQRELNLLNDPTYAGTFDTPDEVKVRRREILQQLDVFRRYPTDALGKVQLDYQRRYVDPYWRKVEARYKTIGKLPKAEKELAYADLRAWKDGQAKPVEVNGVRFPAPLEMAWATLDPVTRDQRLKAIAGGTWDHLADYEKKLLGRDVAPGTSDGYRWQGQVENEYRDKYPGARLSAQQKFRAAKAIDRGIPEVGIKPHPGYYKDYVYATMTPRIRIFEATNVYQEMPASLRQQFDEVVGNDARTVSQAMKPGSGYSSTYVSRRWQQFLQREVVPKLSNPQYRRLADWLEPFSPDFLGSLIQVGG